jgi:ABC-type transport system involved in multi-copper enzyme maturation permease subunit
MVWHIFRKDWKLGWKFFVAVAVIEFLPAIIRVKLGFFGEDPTLEYLLTPLGNIVILASALLTIAVVQLDSIPSVREDWLTRPVPRGELLLAKLMLAVVLVQGAVLLAETFLCMATGFSLGPAVIAALAQ